MPKGLKIWLWIVLFMDIITFIYYGRLFLLGLSVAAACMIPELLQITGVSILLFHKRRLGFYIICLSEVVIFAANVTLFDGDIVLSLINSVVVPLVIYALMKPYWNCFR